VFGFRYDENRDAHVLRLVGNQVGPVLRNRPPIDRAAAQIEWSACMDELASRRRTGRFARDPRGAEIQARDVVER